MWYGWKAESDWQGYKMFSPQHVLFIYVSHIVTITTLEKVLIDSIGICFTFYIQNGDSL